MNGTISVQSTLGEGSQFIVSVEVGISSEVAVEARQRLGVMNKNIAVGVLNEFPRIFHTSNDGQSLAEQIGNSPRKTTTLVGQRLLLVEDNEINQEIMVELLTGLGIVVTTASNGQEGWDLVKTEPFDLVLMDIEMPIMDGLTATKLIRADSRFTDLPIIALTSHSRKCDKEKSLAAGLNDHICRPIDLKNFTETLKFWLQRHPETHTR
jgi:CheY-like chemotaxis protein